jgi:hypothetical protein
VVFLNARRENAQQFKGDNLDSSKNEVVDMRNNFIDKICCFIMNSDEKMEHA